MPIPASGSGCQRVGESKQTQVNSPPTGSKRVRKEENGRPYMFRHASDSGCQIVDESKQTQVNSPPTGSKEAGKEERERPGVSGVSPGRGCHTAWSEEAQANVGASDGQCPVEYIIVDSPDDSPVNKTAAHDI